MALELKSFDSLDQPDEDSYETPMDMFERLQSQYGMKFELDVATNSQPNEYYNSKCYHHLDNAMFQEWVIENWKVKEDVWCNPPHSMNEEFIRRADAQHKKHNINIVMIVPANVVGTKTWHELIETETKCMVENHPLKGRPKFLKLGRKTKHPSRNSYVIIVWRAEQSLNSRYRK